MAEYVVASVESGGELVVRVSKVFEAVLPETHVLEAAEGLLVRRYPIGSAKGHHEKQASDVGEDGAQHQGT